MDPVPELDVCGHCGSLLCLRYLEQGRSIHEVGIQQELTALWIKIPRFHEKVGPQGE